MECKLRFELWRNPESRSALHASLAKIRGLKKHCWQSRVGGSCSTPPLPSIPSDITSSILPQNMVTFLTYWQRLSLFMKDGTLLLHVD